MVRHGSLIKLKPDWEERYIILHQHVFSEVLIRIRKSNIRNYSIYLRQGILFSYYEYIGNDLEQDMAQMAEDPVTQDWWKLTDPMQTPLESRKEGEWWALMDEVFHQSKKNVPDERKRRIALNSELSDYSVNQVIDFIKTAYPKQKETSNLKDIQSFSVFRKDNCFYSYLEFSDKDSRVETPKITECLNKESKLNWRVMKEVFHTD